MPLKTLNIPTSIDKKLLARVGKEAFLFLGKSPEVSLNFVPEAEISRLNEVYRGKKGATDVLSFEDEDGSGDIVINLKEAQKDAKDWGTGTNEVACLLLAHGILHLSGYDHQNSKERAKMEEAESAILNKIGVQIDRGN